EHTDYTYDVNGDIQTVTDPNRNVTTYSLYDQFGNAGMIEVQGHGVDIITRQPFDVRSRLVESSDTFGRLVRYAYDGLDGVIKERHLHAGQGSTDRELNYQFTPHGELISRIRIQPELPTGMQETDYEYDAMNRRVRTIEQGITPDPGLSRFETVWMYD